MKDQNIIIMDLGIQFKLLLLFESNGCLQNDYRCVCVLTVFESGPSVYEESRAGPLKFIGRVKVEVLISYTIKKSKNNALS